MDTTNAAPNPDKQESGYGSPAPEDEMPGNVPSSEAEMDQNNTDGEDTGSQSSSAEDDADAAGA